MRQLTMVNDEFSHHIDLVLAGDQSRQYEAQRRRKDGRIIDVLTTVLPWQVDGQVVGITGVTIDITERKRYEQRLRDLVDHDALTGLLNRRSFTRELNAHAIRVNRYGPEGALMLIDLDHFKYINDALGHQAGDEIIRAGAAQLTNRLRASDVLARLGGDEFAVLLPKADAATANEVAIELQKALNGERATPGRAGLRGTTASFGIATFQPPLTGAEVLVNADLAMYDAKEAGRNRIVVYGSTNSASRCSHSRSSTIAPARRPSTSCCSGCATSTAACSRRPRSCRPPSASTSSRRSTRGSYDTRSSCLPTTGCRASHCRAHQPFRAFAG